MVGLKLVNESHGHWKAEGKEELSRAAPQPFTIQPLTQLRRIEIPLRPTSGVDNSLAATVKLRSNRPRETSDQNTTNLCQHGTSYFKFGS